MTQQRLSLARGTADQPVANELAPEFIAYQTIPGPRVSQALQAEELCIVASAESSDESSEDEFEFEFGSMMGGNDLIYY